MYIEQVFYQATDTAKLSGLIYKSQNKTNKILISTHGMATNCLKKRDKEIAKKLTENNIDCLVYNNRGHDIITYTRKETGKKLTGTAYEDVEARDLVLIGTINYAISKGYEKIYLQGHSLGATKTLYTYNKLKCESNGITVDSVNTVTTMSKNEANKILKHINAVILLSLIDIPFATKIYLGKEYPQIMTYAKNMEKENMQDILMPVQAFIHPISVKTFLKYTRDYSNIDFARYSDINYTYPELNNIDVPLFMRWGNNKELIMQKADELCDILSNKIQNNRLDIDYIDGANHSYTDKEEILASQICNFIKKGQTS